MRTALEELIKTLEISVLTERQVCEEQDKYHRLDVRQAQMIVSEADRTIALAKSLLEKEKQQIIYACHAGKVMQSREGDKTPESYYNSTFNK